MYGYTYGYTVKYTSTSTAGGIGTMIIGSTFIVG